MKILSTSRLIMQGALSLIAILFITGCASTSSTSSTSGGSTQYVQQKKVDPMELRAYRFPSSRPATGRTVFIFDPSHKMWAAYSPDGQLVKQGAASGGRGYCPDVGRPCRTPVGKYAVYRKGSPSCKSSKYPLGKGGAPMPYCMHFKGGYAIHGSPHVPNYNASHGCIRVPPSDAAWLSHNFVKPGTQVIVKPY